jgi:DNA-binding LacI/PurR family transcriptional regulator/signal transduction histidine kinase
MCAAAQERNVRLLMLDGGVLGHPDQPPIPENRVYQFSTADELDAVIVWKAAISYAVNDEEFKQFLAGLRVPAVIIEGRVDGHPTIDLDTANGVVSVMEHLYTDHGYRRFGFLGQHEHHEGFRKRYECFHDYLESRGIEPVPQAIKPFLIHGVEQTIDGKFGSGQIGGWLSEVMKNNVEVIVCASDWVASQLLIALNDLGFLVPRDIAVVGFDDSRHSSWIDPPMTTAGGAWEAIGQKAVLTALDLFDGTPVASEQLIPVHLIIRESCGCDFLRTNKFDSYLTNGMDLQEQLFRLAEADQCPMSQELAHDLAEAWMAEADHDGRLFLRVLKTWLERGVRYQGPFAPWQGLLSILFAHKPSRRTAKPETFEMTARALVAHFGERSTGYRMYSSGLFDLRESDLGLALIACRDRIELDHVLSTYLPGLDIRKWSLVVDGDPVASPIGMRPWNYDSGSKPYWIVQGLVADGNSIGYIAYQSGTINDMRLSRVTKRIGQALLSINQRSKIEKHAQILENTLIHLKQTTGQLVHSEKLAAIGTLVCGIAHQLNTPVGTMLTASTYQLKVIGEYADMIDPDNQPMDHIRDLLERSNKIILAGTEKIIHIINRIKQLSHFPQNRTDEVFQVGTFCRTLINTFKDLPSDTRITWNIEIADNLLFACSPEAIGPVMTNLISNSLSHGFRGKTSGKIDIHIRKDDTGNLLWTYADDGNGIPELERSSLYLPFHAAMKGRNPGLGTFLIHSLITQALNGTIEAQFPVEGGLRYEIYIPAAK